MIETFFRSCHKSDSSSSVQREAILRERVYQLEKETLGPGDLGNAIAIPTDNTEFIIEQKEAAVPVLVEALKEETKPVLMGYAAYCLRRIGSNRGKDAAARQYQKLLVRGSDLTLEELFARSELKNYLEQLKPGSNK
jgi:hypothetical protein